MEHMVKKKEHISFIEERTRSYKSNMEIQYQ